VVQLAIVQGFEGDANGYTTGFVGLFSPRRSTYDLTFAPDTLVSTSGLNEFGTTAPTDLVWTDTSTEVRDTLVDVSSLRTFIAEQTQPAPVTVESNLERQNNRIAGTIALQGDIALEEALLVSGDSVQPLGTLTPGASERVLLQLRQNNFPLQAQASIDGLFNRQETLNYLFENTGFATSGLPTITGAHLPAFADEGVYLMGWHENGVIDVTVPNATVETQGSTLYVIRLASGDTSPQE
jgi:hypothetical protein